MPVIGGLKTPNDTSKIEEAKELYLAGNDWQSIAQKTGLKLLYLQTTASRKGWTALRREMVAKADTEGETVKANFAKSLVSLSSKLADSKPATLKAACAIQSMLVPAVQNAKTVFGWGEQSSNNTLVNVAILSQCGEPVQASVRQPNTTVDAEIVPEQSMLNSGHDSTEEKG